VASSKVGRLAAGTLVSMVAAALPLLGAGVANAAPTAAEVVIYDASGAAAWSANVTAAVANWNSAEQNVQLVAGTPSQATVHLVDDPGWPETSTGRPGSGTVYLGEEAVAEGYDKTRITAHELGHILGLPDNYNGDCALLMSGHSAGTDCTTAVPATTEAAEVDEIFASTSNTETARKPAAQQAVLTRTVF
jgi:snapalysin